jgi:hypothetical protein
MLYTRRAQFRGRLAFFDQSKKFSVDTIYYEDPFFTHKYWQLQPRAEGFITHKEVLHFLAPVKTWYSSADDPPPTEAPVQSREAAQTEQEPVQLQTLTPSEFERPSMEPMVARK